jgi:molybdate transport system substrate-binding protein
MQNVVKVLSTLAVMGAVRGVSEQYEAGFGARIEADFAPTGALLERLGSGEAADVVILTRQALDDLTAAGSVVADSRVDLARSYVGLAVKAGAPRPRVATDADLRAALLGAGSVAYSRIGASGIFFAQLIERMGIASKVNAKARIIPSGLTAELLVPGVEIVGPIPVDMQTPMVFSAGRLASSERPIQSDRLLKFLASPEVASALRESGLEL